MDITKLRGQTQYIPLIIMLVITILIALLLGNVVANQTTLMFANQTTVAGAGGTLNTNFTSGTFALGQLIPLLWVLLPVAILVGAVILFFGTRK